MFKKVILGISGGIDSAVAGLLLKNKGFNITAVFMKNWDTLDEYGECQADKDYEIAEWVCNKIKIPILQVNFVKEFWHEVFEDLLQSYQTGHTTIPDVVCNQKIKFGKFFEYARQELGADAVATGHYAKTSFGPYLENFNPNSSVALLQARDFAKDQTFFLCQVKQEALRRTMFPLGDFLKSDIKRIAQEANLIPVVQKKESTGICFIGKRNFSDFIEQYVENKPGDFVDFETFKVVGKHNGIHHWTIGQRSKLVEGTSAYYIYQKDATNNIIYVVHGNKHPLFYSDLITTSEPHWIKDEPVQLRNNGIFECRFRYQHQEPFIPCTIFKTTNKLIIKLEQPQRAIMIGQYAVLYSDEECLGSAKIVYPGPNYHFMDKEVPEETKELKCEIKM